MSRNMHDAALPESSAPAEGRAERLAVYRRCGGCGKKQEFVNSGKFRVNANGKNVDVWLIFRCKKCKHSWNMTIYERTKPSKIPRELFEAFQENDEDTALAYGNDTALLNKNRAEWKMVPVEPEESQEEEW